MSSPTFDIWKDSSIYYAQDEETGRVLSNPRYIPLYNSIIASGVKLNFDPGIYEIDTQDGMVSTNLSNFKWLGDPYGGTIFKETYPATAVAPLSQLFAIDGVGSNVLLQNLNWDMNEDAYSNSQRTMDSGVAWIGRVGQTTDITITQNKFLNTHGCGLVGSGINGLTFSHNYMDNIGEHAFYISDSKNLHIYDLTLLNYARWIRGWVTNFRNNDNVLLENFYINPNENGEGYKDTLGIGSGAAGPTMSAICTTITIRNGKMDNDGVTTRPAILVQGTPNNILVDGIETNGWTNLSFFGVDASHTAIVRNSKFRGLTIDYAPWLMENCTIIDEPRYSDISLSGATLRNVTFLRENGPNCPNPRILWIGRGIPTSNVLLENCKFINYGGAPGFYGCGVDMSYAIDSTMRRCIFSGGFKDWAVRAGGIRNILDDNTFMKDTRYGTVAIELSAGTGNKISNTKLHANLHNIIDPTYGTETGTIIVRQIDYTCQPLEADARADIGGTITAPGEATVAPQQSQIRVVFPKRIVI